jgi:hypothetical protein
MKRFYLLLVMVLTLAVSSCGTARYASQRSVNEMDEISYVLANYYPQLHTYYMEGVLRVNSLKEVVLPDGTVDYKVKYDFVRYYYTDFNEKIAAVKANYPELYEMYVSGVIDLGSVYKYVDRDSGRIRLHVSYSRIYDYYYHYYPGTYGGLRLHYRPRPYPLAPRRMQPPPPQPRPRPEARPNNPPRPQPNTGPTNPPRGGNQGGRPATPPQSNNRGGQGRRR